MYGSVQKRDAAWIKLPPVRDPAIIRPCDLLVTREVLCSRNRVPNLRAERAAFDELATILVGDPARVLQRLLDCVLRLYAAGSAGLSVLQAGSCGHSDFVWEVVSGALTPHRGDGTPSDFGPCGLCLDIGTAIVVARPERAFGYLARVQPVIVEALIVPLYDAEGTPLGALWVFHHNHAARFGDNDVRLIERFAAPTALALQRRPNSDSVALH
jgi:GAF domain-containing protein